MSEFNTAVNNATAGATITLKNGTWNNVNLSFATNGNSGNPITLRAETPGQVILNGTSRLDISGSWLVVDGLRFEGGALSNGSDAIVQFRGSNGNATNSRLTNTQIKNYNPADPGARYHWVSLYGQNNQVDHSSFQGQNHSGVTVVAVLDGNPASHRIESNSFLDRPVGSTGNGYESIRIGDSSTQKTHAAVIVQNNLFQGANGEIEIISNKSADNIYRYNTIRESEGTITLRHGNAATVEGNFILGGGLAKSGGIRVVDEGHTIVNNYIADIGDRAKGAISIATGVNDPTYGTPVTSYQPVKNLSILNNTIVDVKGSAMIFDWENGGNFTFRPAGSSQDVTINKNVLATNVSVINNLIRSTTSTNLFEGMEGSGWTWENNIAFGAALGMSARAGVIQVNPQLVLGADGLYRPASHSPAINAGTSLSSVTTDMDGQARIDIGIDIGADEVSVATISRKPLTTADVGPNWNSTVMSPPAGPFVALQAESFRAVSDPNGDGRIWQLVQDASAHNGWAIEAPGAVTGGGAGTRTDLPGTHDTLALYDLMFSEAGAYTAYYRAMGINGSSDSFYSPTAFGIDPTVSETTSQGLFDWVKGELFTISESNVGMPLELRLGRREGLNRLDAIVFHQNSNLTSAQLDALFTAVPEPGTALLLTSLLPLTLLRRRRPTNQAKRIG